jgi:two-component system, chemotaxis family, CheB/CheR fusion protein
MIVGMGASAGGLGAFTTFFGNMPADSGMAFVLVQHLSPDHKSMLADILGKATAMAVTEAEDGMPPAANTVYVIPPDATLTCKDHTLRVSRPAPPRERRRPIYTFFSSLAEDQGENAVCIVLSGTGSDGTLGVKAIKERGGLALAQAGFDHEAMGGMPHSAAATGLVDEVMPVKDMPAKLLNYRDHLLAVAPRKDGDGTRSDMAAHLARITAILRAKVGHDFSKYKEKTLARRIQRRMQVLQTDTVPAYIARLDEEPREAELLFRELLIGVTQFFRDPDAFAALEAAAIPKLLEGKGADDQLRIWVPGCATGEEVYSIAILVKEAMERCARVPNVVIFGTDIDADEVSIARHGRFRRMAGLSSERLRRWFVREGDEYCPVREVRDICVFSNHSVVKDPPFSKLDLISCRNLLIYLDADLQDRVLRIFHFALNPHGILFLGPSEGVPRFTKAFETLVQKHRIYRRRESVAAPPELPHAATPQQARPAATPVILHGEDRIDRGARRVLEKHSPVYMVVDRNHQILRFSGGEAGRYLEPSSGAASLDLFGILRKALRPAVRAALQAARATSEPVVHDGVPVKIDGKNRLVTVIIETIAEGGAEAGLFVVAFRDSGGAANGGHATGLADVSNAEVKALKHELLRTKAQLQITINELETTNEEMKSAAEEYQSVNEELQSSNEELETAKEEMQSINEELQTINAEVTSKNQLLTRLNSDIKNLLDSTAIATIFLDNDLCVKSYTPAIADIFPLREADRGRPIFDIVTQLTYSDPQDSDLRNDVEIVLRELSVVEREVEIAEKRMTFIMRVRPYRTIDNVNDGVVITFMDISERKKADASERKKADAAIQASKQLYSVIVRQATVGVAETDLNMRFILVNDAYCELVGRSARELQTLRIQDTTHPEDWSASADRYNRLLAGGEAFEYERRFVHPDGNTIWVQTSASAIKDEQGRPRSLLSINVDISARKRAEGAAALLLAELDHRVKNILAIVTALVGQTLKATPAPGEFAAAIQGRIAAIARAHSLAVEKDGRVQASLREIIAAEFAPYDSRGHKLAIDGDDVALTPNAGLALALVMHELVSNAAKYGSLSTPAGRLAVAWENIGGAPNRKLKLTWTETGGPRVKRPSRKGFGTKLLERSLVHQFDATVTTEFKETGLRCIIEIPLTAEFGKMRISNEEGKAR